MYRQKGTAKGIQNAIRFFLGVFLGIDISAITPFNADTLILGESELGIDWVLGPSSVRTSVAAEVVEVRVGLREAFEFPLCRCAFIVSERSGFFLSQTMTEFYGPKLLRT